MNNPYQVLGVDGNSSDDAVKAAYRRLAEKYSADNYAGSPLADLAQNKLREIDDAYDQIMSERRVGQSAQNNAPPNYSGYADSSQNGFANIRSLLGSNRLDEAENLLLQIPAGQRNAEWNFLMGNLNYSRGWLDEASRYFSIAVSMDPGNREYAAANNRVRKGRQGYAAGNPYSGYSPSRNTGGCSGCDICTGLMCADCLCKCFGGRGFCC